METNKQEQINKSIVISGLFANENENLLNIVAEISSTIKSSCKIEDIKTVFRKQDGGGAAGGMPPPIVVEFCNKNVRDNFLNKKKGVSLSTEAIKSYVGVARPIYIGESLTKFKQFVFKRARDLKRDNVVKFAWVKDGEIFVRESENSRIIKIKHPRQIDEFNK